VSTILVVDDDPDLRVALVDVLEESGYRVLTAEHGLAALEVLKTETPNLILLDVMMPVMNGLDFAAELKKNPEKAEIPIVIFSAHTDHQQVADSLHVAGSLGKPVKVDDLLAAIEAIKT
jgi:two-component system chemotaxis response regulator CheY